MPLLGRVRGGGEDSYRNIPVHMGPQSMGQLWKKLHVSTGHLLGLQKTRNFLCGPQVAGMSYVG